jgi:peptide-methionine (S)-S-oxide reductase
VRARQPAILIAALAGTLAYAWLRGAFEMAALEPPPAPASMRVPDVPLDVATLAAGCFWCVEADFDKIPGVVATISGYTGGRSVNPSYAAVSSGATGHAEAVAIHFDTRIVSFEAILAHFWRNVDPFAAHSQFCDVGRQYRPEIYVRNEEQRRAAEASKVDIERRLGRPVVVPISDAATFYPAEPHHQDYAERHPVQYRFYRWSCGRDRRLAELWGAS